MEKKYEKTKEERQEQTKQKIDKMRSVVYDEEKCKEIAQKLCAYISGNS